LGGIVVVIVVGLVVGNMVVRGTDAGNVGISEAGIVAGCVVIPCPEGFTGV